MLSLQKLQFHRLISYLGIKLTPGISLFVANYPSCGFQIHDLLNVWCSYPIFFLGSVTAIKMNVLPKLLYLFRALPIAISKYFIEGACPSSGP